MKETLHRKFTKQAQEHISLFLEKTALICGFADAVTSTN